MEGLSQIFSELALPNDVRFPAEFFEVAPIAAVAIFIGHDFRLPIIQFALGQFSPAATVAVPEAAVDENRFARFSKNEVGPARKLFVMQAVAIAFGVEEAAQNELRTGVSRADAGHYVTANFR